jgi:hypothetical protein
MQRLSVLLLRLGLLLQLRLSVLLVQCRLLGRLTDLLDLLDLMNL